MVLVLEWFIDRFTPSKPISHPLTFSPSRLSICYRASTKISVASCLPSHPSFALTICLPILFSPLCYLSVTSLLQGIDKDFDKIVAQLGEVDKMILKIDNIEVLCGVRCCLLLCFYCMLSHAKNLSGYLIRLTLTNLYSYC
jgi:hypothetical protein